MNRFVCATVVFLAPLAVLAQSQRKATTAKPEPTVTAEQQACKDRLKELSEPGLRLDALSNEKLGSIESQLNDCIYAENAGDRKSVV